MNSRRYQLIREKYWEFFFPTLAIAMANNIATFVDSLLVSNFLGVNRLPAVQLCFPIVAFMNFFFTMLGSGGSLTAANAQADHDRKKGCYIYTISVATIISVSVFFAAFFTIFKTNIVTLLCSNITLREDVGAYYSVMVLGLPFMCLLMCLSFFIRSDGCVQKASYSIIISNSVNLIMDCVFLKGFKFGIAWAAFATIIGYICGLLYLMFSYVGYPKRQFKLVPLHAYDLYSYMKDVMAVCGKGFSTAAVSLYLFISVQTFNNLVLSYGGALGMQAYTICRNSMSLAYIYIIGTAQTMSPIVGVYTHEGDYDRARFILKQSIRIELLASLLMLLVLLVFPSSLLWLFGLATSNDSEFFCQAIRVFSLIYPALSFSFAMNYYFQAIDRKKLSAALTFLEGLFFPVGLAYFFIPNFGMMGCWVSLIIGEVLTALLIIVFLMWDFYGNKRQYLLPINNEVSGVEFSIEPDIQKMVHVSEEASKYIEKRTDSKTATITCFALEEMLTGIALANGDARISIDVLLRDTEDEVIISVRDTGCGFNPLLKDDSLSYTFSNAQVLQKIASEMKYDILLGMNDTRIYLNKRD